MTKVVGINLKFGGVLLGFFHTEWPSQPSLLSNVFLTICMFPWVHRLSCHRSFPNTKTECGESPKSARCGLNLTRRYILEKKMRVSWNGGTSKSSILMDFFHYKPTSYWDPPFMETPKWNQWTWHCNQESRPCCKHLIELVSHCLIACSSNDPTMPIMAIDCTATPNATK